MSDRQAKARRAVRPRRFPALPSPSLSRLVLSRPRVRRSIYLKRPDHLSVRGQCNDGRRPRDDTVIRAPTSRCLASTLDAGEASQSSGPFREAKRRPETDARRHARRHRIGAPLLRPLPAPSARVRAAPRLPALSDSATMRRSNGGLGVGWG